MKKQFQILSIATAIVFFSCGKHNAEITGPFTTGIKEFSTKSPSQLNEPDLLLMDNEGRIRFNAEPGDQEKELFNLSVKRSSLTIERGEAQDPSISSMSYSVN
jgi:hypothetical protein